MFTTSIPSPQSAGNGHVQKSKQQPRQESRQQPGSACEECRRKRIRCDRGAPTCEACANAGVVCVVRSHCPSRGPKKGYIRTLRRQIEDLQAQLNERQEENIITVDTDSASSRTENTGTNEDDEEEEDREEEEEEGEGGDTQFTPATSLTGIPSSFDTGQFWSAPMLGIVNPSPITASALLDPNLAFSRVKATACQVPSVPQCGLELTGMVCTDLDQLFFDRVYPFAPVVQRFRYRSWSKQPQKSKAKMCLQYAMWTVAASLSSQFQLLRVKLYKEARQLLDALDNDSQEDQPQPYSISCEQIQAWLLLAVYELTSDDGKFQRGMVSAGRAFRLVQLMRLHEVDRVIHDGPVDWIDSETRRRTFWLAFVIDRLTSVIDELPLTFDEGQINSRLPASDTHFTSGRPTTMPFLSEAINGFGTEWPTETVSSFTESILVATIGGRTLEGKQRPFRDHPYLPHANTADRRGGWDAAYDFCRRYQFLDALLTQHIKTLSARVLSTIEQPDPIIIFVSLVAYMAVFIMCETIEATQVANALLAEHKQRSLEAVGQLRVLIALLAQINHFQTHPFTPIPLLLGGRFCLARTGLNDAYGSLLPDIVVALQALTEFNGLAQVCLELLGFGLGDPKSIDGYIEH